jgi:hypothetical protein
VIANVVGELSKFDEDAMAAAVRQAVECSGGGAAGGGREEPVSQMAGLSLQNRGCAKEAAMAHKEVEKARHLAGLAAERRRAEEEARHKEATKLRRISRKDKERCRAE